VSIERTVIAIVLTDTVDSSTITTDTVALSDGVNTVSGTIDVSDNVITFAPSTYLGSNTNFSLTITTDITDLSGYSMG
jgi:Big-like domain-containing protein